MTISRILSVLFFIFSICHLYSQPVTGSVCETTVSCTNGSTICPSPTSSFTQVVTATATGELEITVSLVSYGCPDQNPFNPDVLFANIFDEDNDPISSLGFMAIGPNGTGTNSYSNCVVEGYEYTVVIEGNGDYEIDWMTTASPYQDAEPNNSISEALTISGYYGGNIDFEGSGDTHDYYSYTMPSDGNIKIELDALAPSAKGRIKVSGYNEVLNIIDDGSTTRTYSLDCLNEGDEVLFFVTRAQNPYSECKEYSLNVTPLDSSKVSIERYVKSRGINPFDGSWYEGNVYPSNTMFVGTDDYNVVQGNNTNGRYHTINGWSASPSFYSYQGEVNGKTYKTSFDLPPYCVEDEYFYWPVTLFSQIETEIQNNAADDIFLCVNDIPELCSWVSDIEDIENQEAIFAAMGKVFTLNKAADLYDDEFDELIDIQAEQIVKTMKSVNSLGKYFTKLDKSIDEVLAVDFNQNSLETAALYSKIEKKILRVTNEIVAKHLMNLIPFEPKLVKTLSKEAIKGIIREVFSERDKIKEGVFELLFFESIKLVLKKLFQIVHSSILESTIGSVKNQLEINPYSSEEYFNLTIDQANPNSIYLQNIDSRDFALNLYQTNSAIVDSYSEFSDILNTLPGAVFRGSAGLIKSVNLGATATTNAVIVSKYYDVNTSMDRIAESTNGPVNFAPFPISSALRSSSDPLFSASKNRYHNFLNTIQNIDISNDSIALVEQFDSLFIHQQWIDDALDSLYSDVIAKAEIADTTFSSFDSLYQVREQYAFDFSLETLNLFSWVGDHTIFGGISNDDSLSMVISDLLLELDSLEMITCEMKTLTSGIANPDHFIRIINYEAVELSDGSYEFNVDFMNDGGASLSSFHPILSLDSDLILTSPDSVEIQNIGSKEVISHTWTFDNPNPNNPETYFFMIEYSSTDVHDGNSILGYFYLSSLQIECDTILENKIADVSTGHFKFTNADTICEGDDVLIAFEVFDADTLFASPGTIISGQNRPTSVSTKDINQDGFLDFAGTNRDSNEIAWFENDGSGSFVKHLVPSTTIKPNYIKVEDVDGDGDFDFVVSSQDDDKVSWYENNGSQSFTEHVISSNANYAVFVDVKDVDLDGDLDVLSASYLDDKIAWYENDGSQNFTELVITSSLNGAFSVKAEDVDLDGDVDVLASGRLSDSFVWYENDGTQNFTEHILAENLDAAIELEIVDVDQDGDNDLLGLCYSDDGLYLFENDGNSNFDETPIFNLAEGAYDIEIADVDNDQDSDIVLSDFDGENIFILTNIGNGSFSELVEAAPGVDAIRTAVGNFDDDEFNEIVVAAFVDNRYDLIQLEQNPFEGLINLAYSIDNGPTIIRDSISVANGMGTIAIENVIGGDKTLYLEGVSDYFECMVNAQDSIQFRVVPLNLNINNPVTETLYQAVDNINSDAQLNGSQSIVYKAGTQICLDPNFEVNAGTTFEALIDDCNY